MISKELLESITEMKIGYTREEDKGKTIAYSSRFPNSEYWNNHRINIYELAFKCKEWAYNKGYSVVDGIDTIGKKICYIMEIIGYSIDYYYEQTDNYEDVFKACQWILDNKKEGN